MSSFTFKLFKSYSLYPKILKPMQNKLDKEKTVGEEK